MRRIYRKPYTPPQYLGRKKRGNSSSKELVQPEWDDTIHDLTTMKASPEELLRRKLLRTSHNQMGMTLLAAAGGRRSAQSGQQQQERYTPSASHDASDAEGSEDSYEQQQQHQQQWQQQQQHSPGAGSRQLTAQLHHHHYLQQQQQQQQQQQSQPAGCASVLAQYACSSTAGSEDDVCQWQQSPSRPTVRQQQQQQQQRSVLQDIQSSPVGATRRAGSAVRHHKHSSWSQQQQQQQQQQEGLGLPGTTAAAAGTTVTVEAVDLQVLLDKINPLEEQLQDREGQQQEQQQQRRPHSSPDLQQQLAHSQQQLASTQQELHKLRDEHRQYVAHTSTLLTQLQTQVQTLLTGFNTLPSLPSLHQQQHAPSLPSRSSRLQPGTAADERQQQQQQQMVAGSRPAVDVGSSSTQQLFEISNFIRRQLQEQEAAAARPTEAAAAGRVGGALWPPNRAAALGSATAAGGSPSKAAAATVAAAGRLAGPSSACSSPSRKKAERQFTPAVADSIALPSYAAMRQGRAGAGVGAGTGFAAAAAAGAAAGRAGMGGNLRDSGLLGSPPRMAGGSSVGGSNGQAPQVPVGSPKRLQTTQVPRPLPGSSSEQQQQQRGVLGDNAGDTAEGWAAAPRGLSVKAPTGRAAAAAAAVWEAEAAESPRPQQMLVLEEVGNCRMSLAAAEAFGQVPLAGAAASVQLPGDLSALLRDLGLTSLELIAGGLDLEAQQKHLGSSSSGAVGKGGPAVGAGAGDRGASSSRHALVLVSEGMAGPAAATAAGMLSYSRGDGVLAGAADVDRGLQEGLPRAAVGRVYTAAGCVPATSSGEAGGGGPQPRVLKEQLKGNMCFRDHLRAAAAAASGSDS